MARPVVLVQLDGKSADAAQFSRALSDLATAIDLRFASPEAAPELAALAPSVEIWSGANPTPAFLEGAEQLRWLSFFSAGLDSKLNPRLIERRIRITTASGVHAPNIAEHVLAMMLALVHGFPDYGRAQVQHAWQAWQGSRAQGGELAGQTLVIVGLGQIGSALARRAKAFEMKVLAVKRDPTRLPEGATAGIVDTVVGPGELDALLGLADHVALCAPLTDGTRHLFDRERLARVKRGGFLVNIARGGLVDSAALVEALKSGQLAGAGLDVFEQEPLPPESPLWDLPNVIVTPHAAGLTPRYFERCAGLFSANVRRYLADEPLHQQYVPERGY